MNEHVQVITDQNFKEMVLQSERPVLVDFWAPWCGPCRMLGPIIDTLAERYAGQVTVGKINVDENPTVAGSYGVMSIPTVMLFRGGKVEEQIVGVVPEQAFSRILDKHIAA